MGSIFKPKTQTSKSSQENNPWAPAQDDLKNILGEIGDWYDSAKNTGYISSTGDLSGIYGDYINALKDQSGQTNQGVNNLLNQAGGANTGAYQGWSNAANGGLNYTTQDIVSGAQGLVNNDLLQGQIDATNRGIQRNLTEQAFTGIDRNAVGSGNLGSSRAGIAQAVAAREASQQMADNENAIRSNAYNNALSQSQSVLNSNNANMLSGYQGLSGLGNNLASQAGSYANSLNSGLSNLGQAASLEAMLQQNNQANLIGERDYIANLIGQYYLPTAGTIGGMGGTTTGKSQTPGASAFDAILGGAQATGGIMSGLGSMGFSDVRLKKNIKFDTETDDGIKLYTWDWTDEAYDLVGNQSTYGVLAQEVIKTHPEAVSVDGSGYLKVDYSKLH